MGTIKPLFAAFLLVFLTSESFTQSIARQSINSFGTSNVTDGYRISETAGQAYITTTLNTGSFVFHPGFQQQMVAGKKQILIAGEEMLIALYPNPASSILRVVPSQVIEEALITIVDMNGKVISETKYNQLRETSLDVSNWPAGLYAIKIVHAQSLEATSTRILIIK